MKTFIFIITTLFNALSAGFFFAWSVSVILGTKKIGDFTYLDVMQKINREILNPLFYVVFFGSLITLVVTAIIHNDNKTVFWLITAAITIHFFGVFCITAFGNIPLNNTLDKLDILHTTTEELKNFRTNYETRWNNYHNIRTLSNMIAFILLLISIFIEKTF